MEPGTEQGRDNKGEVESILEVLPDFCREFSIRYKTTLKEHGLNPGRIQIVLVGSTFEGGHTDESDIDIKVYIENFQDSPELLRRDPNRQEPDIIQFDNPGDEKFVGFEIGKQIMGKLRTMISELCSENGIDQSRLHFLTFGRPIASEAVDGKVIYDSEGEQSVESSEGKRD